MPDFALVDPVGGGLPSDTGAAVPYRGAVPTTMPLRLTRAQILAHRRRVGALDERLPAGPESLRRAGWLGLADSMPRAAVLSVHARVAGTRSDAWEDPAFVQTWGPRYSAYVVPAADRAVFTVGRLTDDPAGLRRAVETADRLEAFLDGRRLPFGAVGRGMGVAPNSLRYAAPTGRVLIRWDGARQPTIWTVPAPDMEPGEARREMVRRFLHVSGPASAAAFANWAGVKDRRTPGYIEDLAAELSAVRTPIGDGWILAADEASFRGVDPAPEPTVVRLLPSGDAYTFAQGVERELLVEDAARRALLWTPRVWPGAVLAGGEIVGTWRRADRTFTIQAWGPIPAAVRDAIEEEAAALPLPDGAGRHRVIWAD